MNDGWIDAAAGMAMAAQAELAALHLRLATLPVHAPARAMLARQAADLTHRLAAARQVLDAHGAPALPAAAREAA